MLDAIDFILNVAGLLLWLSWRSVRLDPFNRGTPATLAGTVRRAEPMRLKRWHFLAALAGLLLIRAFFYEHIGPAANWTPKLDLALVTPAFPLVIRGHAFFLSAVLFSALSFVRILVVFYFWLLVIAVINRHVTNPDPLQKLLTLQLGRAARWHWFVQLILPFVVSTALWIMFFPLLKFIGVMTPVRSNAVLAAQGVMLGLVLYLSLRYLLIAFLAVYVIINYVYFGTNPVWDFIGTTSRNILSPLNYLPLRFGKLDLAPLIAIALVVLLLFYPVPGKVIDFLNRRDLTLWPH
jgi:uncharacterized protein YggT (Ycf19 family)